MLDAAGTLSPAALVEEIWYSPPIRFDERIVTKIRESASAAGHEPKEGLSHNEAESIFQAHSTAGAEVTLQTVLLLADENTGAAH